MDEQVEHPYLSPEAAAQLEKYDQWMKARRVDSYQVETPGYEPQSEPGLDAPFLPGWQQDPAELQRFKDAQRYWATEHAGTFKSPQEYMDFLKSTEPQSELEPEPHTHGPFTFLMNANHNALRGCITCGQAWVGYMAGGPDTLIWHSVAEIEETQEQD